MMDGYKQEPRSILKVRKSFFFFFFIYFYFLNQVSHLFILSEGDEITLHYSGGLKGRLQRRKMLAEGWFFSCQCQRSENLYLFFTQKNNFNIVDIF